MQISNNPININPVTKNDINDIERQNEKTQHQESKIFAFHSKSTAKLNPHNLCKKINDSKKELATALAVCLGICGASLCTYSEVMDNPHGKQSNEMSELGVILSLCSVAIGLSVFISMIPKIFPVYNNKLNKLKSRIITNPTIQELNPVKNKNTDKSDGKLDSVKIDNINIEKFTNEVCQETTKDKNSCVFI